MLFSKIDVNKVEWLNLVFVNRNQSYGAYQLRRDSGSYLFKSLLITGALFGGGLLLSAINREAKTVDSVIFSQPVIDPEGVKLTPIEVAPKLKQAKLSISPPVSSLATPDVKTVKFSGRLTPVKDNLVVTEVPTSKQIEQSIIGLQNKEGLESAGTNTIDKGGDGNGLEGRREGLGGGTDIYSTNFLEMMPEYPGGMKAWGNFLMKNLNYPRLAAENDITGRVVVSFVIEKNGELSNLKVIKGIGGGCDEEAMRVIKKSPFWKPGMQNGKAVRVAYMMPVVFRME